MWSRARTTAVLSAVLSAGVLLACAPVALAGPDCAPTRTGLRLPDAVDESSGVAVGLSDPSLLWTHNDDGSTLFAVDSAGTLQGSWPVRPALRDWEDLAVAPCDSDGTCLYMADTGDYAERRPAGDVRILRMAEPGQAAAAIQRSEPPLPAGDEPLRAEVFPIRLPDGPRDIEAIFVLPGERVHLVTKGRNHAITVYSYPTPLRPDTVILVEVQRLTDGAQPLANQVTGASAGQGGDLVVIRTYQTMAFYRVEGGQSGGTVGRAGESEESGGSPGRGRGPWTRRAGGPHLRGGVLRRRRIPQPPPVPTLTT